MNKTVVVLQDENSLLELVKPLLEASGYKVVVAPAGADLQDLLKREQPASVLAGGPALLEKLNTVASGDQSVHGVSMPAPVPGHSVVTATPGMTAPSAAHANPPPLSVLLGDKEKSDEAGGSASEQLAAQKAKEFQNMFAALKRKYALALPERLRDVAAAVDHAISRVGAGEEPSAQATRETVRQLAHKIVGTAGSYGYVDLAAAMKIVETTCDAMPTMDEGQVRKAWDKISEQVTIGADHAQEIAGEVSGMVKAAPGMELALAAVQQITLARVLVVDEDEQFLDVVAHAGSQCQVDVVRAGSAREALEKACTASLDAALISITGSSPQESFELAHELRELPGYENLPLAFITDDPLMKDQVEAVHAGASLYLDKPLKPQSLEQAVNYLVGIRQGGRARVLIVDDDEEFAAAIALVLRHEGLIVRSVHDPLKVIDMLNSFPPEMMLLDVNMPGMNGFDVCKMLRATPRWQDLPIIFLTAQTGVDARVAAFQSGGDDYLPKPIINEELLARVRVRLERARMLRERSDKDTITGLLLRRAFMEQLGACHAEADRLKHQFTLCLMDVDHFKKVNDTYGHLAGDRVLSGFGYLLQRRFRVDDLRGRWGGEEFILAFRRESKETMARAVTRLLNEFKELIFEGDQNQQFSVSFSGGIASYPEDGKTIFELVTCADKRLYDAKHAGRCRVVSGSEGT